MNNKSFYLEEKYIYKLFNEVKFDEREFDKMDDEMPEILKKKIKKNLNKKIRSRSYIKAAKRSSVAAAVLLVLLIGAGAVSPTLAKNIPIVNSIFQILNNKFGYFEEYIPYSQLVDKSVTDNGITLTINEALADDAKLILGYTIKSNSKIQGLQVVGLMRFLKVNGSTVGGGSSAGEYLDDTTFVGIDRISYHSQSSSDQLKVDLNVDDIMGIKGKWNFSFTVSKAELVKKTTVFKTTNKVDLPEGIVTVDKVVFTPIDSTIYFSGNYKDKNAETRAMDAVVYRWFIFDGQGTELSSEGGSWGGNADLPYGKDFKGTAQFQKVKNIPQYLTVIPCRFKVTNADSVSENLQTGEETPIIKTKNPSESSQVINGNYPIELSQGKMGKLIIKDITTENGETVVRYTAEGKAPYFQGSSLHVKNAAGEYVTPKRYDIRRDEEHPNDFTMVFPALDLSKQYSVGTFQFENIEFMEDLKFKIELNQ
jgi:hypothetical protein